MKHIIPMLPYRTHQGCYVYGQVILDDVTDTEQITLSTTPPDSLTVVPSKPGLVGRGTVTEYYKRG